jgi:hypothetical protein
MTTERGTRSRVAIGHVLQNDCTDAFATSEIKIGARTFTIASVDDQKFDALLGRACIEPDDVIKSFVDYDNQLIVVRHRLPGDYKRELVLHEIIHVCLEDSGFAQDDVVEQFVSILSPRLAQIVDILGPRIDEVCK